MKFCLFFCVFTDCDCSGIDIRVFLLKNLFIFYWNTLNKFVNSYHLYQITSKTVSLFTLDIYVISYRLIINIVILAITQHWE